MREYQMPYQAPYDYVRLLRFFAYRALEGVEVVDESSYARTVRWTAADGQELFGWLRVHNDEAAHELRVTLSDSLAPCAEAVLHQVERQFDLQCNPAQITQALQGILAVAPAAPVQGVRLPGAFDPFETTVRAVLGQQISVVAANKLAARIAQTYGTPLDAAALAGAPAGLVYAFPCAQDFAALDNIEEKLGVLGVIKTRSRTIFALAQAVLAGAITYEAAGATCPQLETLLSIKGIGPWSANYIAMRTMGYTDAFLETDAGIRHALPDFSPKERLRLAQNWRPWRSYAVIALWNSLG